MKFEWGPEKANTNFSKHGVTFEEATTVFKDRFAMTETDTAHSSDDFSGAVRGKYAARYSTGVALPDYADPDWREKTLVREDAVGEAELESTRSVGRSFLLNFLHQLGARLASPTQPASFDFLAYAEEDRRVQACPVRLRAAIQAS